jgi:hypothetical protein
MDGAVRVIRYATGMGELVDGGYAVAAARGFDPFSGDA